MTAGKTTARIKSFKNIYDDSFNFPTKNSVFI